MNVGLHQFIMETPFWPNGDGDKAHKVVKDETLFCVFVSVTF